MTDYTKEQLHKLVDEINSALVSVFTKYAKDIINLYEESGGQMPILLPDNPQESTLTIMQSLVAINKALMLSCRLQMPQVMPPAKQLPPTPGTELATTPTRDMAHYANGAMKAVKAMALPETEQSKARLEVCRGCDQWTGTSCKQCGCFTKLKVKMPEEKCPLGKW